MLEGLWRMSKIKIGVLGGANIAERFIFPGIIALPELFELAGIATRSKEKAQKLKKKYQVSVVNDYEFIINKSEIDAVYIPLPNSLHSEWIEKALNANKHVLVEKSMACTAEEVIVLNDLAKNKGLVLVENFQFRFHKQLAKIKQIISSGSIGEIRNIKSSFGFPPFPDKENIRYKKELGGGALLDAGAYPLKLAQELLGNNLFVDSASLYSDSLLGVDIWGAAQLKAVNRKLVVQIAFGFDNAYLCNLEVWGSKGILKAHRIFTSPPGVNAQLFLSTSDGEEVIIIEEDNHFENMLKHFASLILDKNNIDFIDSEYRANIMQATLINQVKDKASEQ